MPDAMLLRLDPVLLREAKKRAPRLDPVLLREAHNEGQMKIGALI